MYKLFKQCAGFFVAIFIVVFAGSALLTIELLKRLKRYVVKLRNSY